VTGGAARFPKLLPRQPGVLGLAPLHLADRHAVGTDRTADEKTLARHPDILALAPEKGRCHRPEYAERIVLGERVLLKFLPVVVPTRQHRLHQTIEIRLGRRRGRQ